MTQSEIETIRKNIEAYSAKNRYDVSYMLEMLESNPEAYLLFQNVIPLANCRKVTPLDVYTVAKLTAFRQSDCGACLQLSIRLALEAGVSVEIVKAAVLGTPALPPHLEQIREFVRAVEDDLALADVLREEIRKLYGSAALVELALVITAAHQFPRAKRVMGYFKSCERMEFSFE